MITTDTATRARGGQSLPTSSDWGALAHSSLPNVGDVTACARRPSTCYLLESTVAPVTGLATVEGPVDWTWSGSRPTRRRAPQSGSPSLRTQHVAEQLLESCPIVDSRGLHMALPT